MAWTRSRYTSRAMAESYVSAYRETVRSAGARRTVRADRVGWFAAPLYRGRAATAEGVTRVTAVVPVLNGRQYLERAVESLLSTAYPNLEIVVVDDGSEDGSLELAQVLATRNPGKIFAIRHADGGRHGVSASRNLGIRRSGGAYVCFLDADDFVFPHRFETAVATLDSTPDVGGVYELTKIVVEGAVDDELRMFEDGQLFGITEPLTDGDLAAALQRGVPWHTSGILFRRSLLEATGLFHEGLSIAEDCHLWLRAVLLGRIVPGEMSRPVSAYVRHQTNTFQPSLERKTDMVRALVDAYRWTFRHRIDPEKRRHFKRVLLTYVVNAVSVAREAQRPDVAWSVLLTVARSGGPDLSSDPRLLRQTAALCRAPVRKAAARAFPGMRRR